MKIVQLPYCLILLFGFTNRLIAQDAHFSQFDANPLYINPALSGERQESYTGAQFHLNFRDQASRFTGFNGSYRNIAFTADMALNSKFSAAALVYNHTVANDALNSLGILASGSYKLIKSPAEKSSLYNLQVGLQIGLLNQKIDPDNLNYATQYSPDAESGFDHSIPNQENYVRVSYTNLNLNFGLYFQGRSKNKKASYFSGFSIYNITQQNESFFGAYSPAAIRYNLHGGMLVRLDESVQIKPQFLYMNQAKAEELNISVLLYTRIKGTEYEPLFGLGFRNKDALIFQGGIKYKGSCLRLSYDVLTSSLKNYRNSGFEFSLIHTLRGKSEQTTIPQNSN